MIQPQVSMPVLYWPHKDDHLGSEPLAATIARVWSTGLVNLSIVDASGLVQNRTSVPLYQGAGNADEIFGVHGRFCEFPQWFINLMGPPTFIVNPGPIVDWGDPKLSAAAAPAVHPTVAGVVGGAYTFRGCGDARCTLCGCIPTSQVLG